MVKIQLILQGIATAALVFGITSARTVSAEPGDLLPNLTALKATDIQIAQIKGKKHIKFSTTSWNSGEGDLELRGTTKNRQTGKQQVMQRIFTSADRSSSRDVEAGWFSHHKAHGHIHFDDYAVYTLTPLNGTEARARSSKTTFCIMDTHWQNPDKAVPQTQARYTECNSQVQGMSVGWGDTYGYQLDGQELNINNLPDGDYTLRIEIDPNDKINEFSDADNTSEVNINITGNKITLL